MPEISEDDLKSLNDAKTELGTLKESATGLTTELGNLKTAKDSLERKLDDADKELLSDSYLDFKSGKGKSNAKDDDDDGKGFDFENASGKEIATHLSGKTKSQIEDSLKGITSRIETTEASMGKALAQIDVTLSALRHSDFDTNKDAIYAIAKDNPSWPAEKCYSQWKLESKAATDQKAVEVEAKAKEERRLLAEKGEGDLSSLVTSKDLSPEQAAELAYEKSFPGTEK